MVRTMFRMGMAALFAAAIAAPASAATLEIHFTGLNLVFENGTIHDSTSLLGGNGDPSEADALATMDFFVDDVLVGSLTSDIYADVALFGIDPIPVSGGMVSAFGGGFDLLTSAAGWGLGLDLSGMSLVYFGSEIALSGAASVVDIFAQNLPFDLVMGQPVEVLFVLGTLANVTDDGQFLTGFDGTGTGSVAGVVASAVPEPTSLILLGSGLVGLAARMRRRRQDA